MSAPIVRGLCTAILYFFMRMCEKVLEKYFPL